MSCSATIDRERHLDWTALCRQPRWDPARVRGLSARCRGAAIGNWTEFCDRRFGPQVSAGVRETLRGRGVAVPERPEPSAWFPVATQILLVDAIVDAVGAPDVGALEPALLASVRERLGTWSRRMLRALGPERLLALGQRTFAELYGTSRMRVVVGPGRATLRWTDDELFANPTWQALAGVAHRCLLAVIDCPVPEVEATASPRSLELRIRW